MFQPQKLGCNIFEYSAPDHQRWRVLLGMVDSFWKLRTPDPRVLLLYRTMYGENALREHEEYYENCILLQFLLAS